LASTTRVQTSRFVARLRYPCNDGDCLRGGPSRSLSATNLEIDPMNAVTADALPAFAQPRVERWPTEIPLFVLVVLASVAIWLLLAVSVIGGIYAAMIALFLFFSHVVFVTHVRGSAVRLGPQQFPELWQRVEELSRRAGLAAPPEAYLMEAGGSLNAFATKLFRGRMIVLFSDLLEACGDDHAARDMVIGHEIGHLRLGHLDWFMLTAPGRFFPFLGSAYSRAREYSCDRWGAALCGDRAGATRGLAILAAGGRHGGKVNLQAFVAQRQALDTGWMTIGSWLSTYPPLSARVEALDPALGKGLPYSTRGTMRAAFILSAVLVLPGAVTMVGVSLWMAMLQSQLQAAADVGTEAVEEPPVFVGTPQERVAKAQADLAQLSDVIRRHHAATGQVLADSDELAAVWSDYHASEAPPFDPFDGYAYGVVAEEEGVRVFSSGPDAEGHTDDDLVVTVDF
jgi:Zn-dependent protease with chaperone function